ncbi:MAG: hemerythrin family protein [Magnetococcales bacterium]|nr:hemerythrin family protein [Magnetococcales bacterium]
MDEVKWSESFAVGNAQLDEQHRRLFGLFHSLVDILSHREDVSRLNEILIELKRYVISHFSFEEQLMRNGDYPKLEEHQTEHDRIAGRLKEFTELLHVTASEEERLRIASELGRFLENWLREHVMAKDRDYVPHIQAH